MLVALLAYLAADASALAPRESASGLHRVALGMAAEPVAGPGISPARNVLGSDLECCCANVRDSGIGTGFFRDGHCSTGVSDAGRHTVCVEATDDFLAFSRAVGNDLSTPRAEYIFPGLRGGDKWCLCAARWEQARLAGCPPRVFLRATHEKTLQYTTIDHLKANAVDLDESEEDIRRLDILREEAMRIAGLADPQK